MRLMLRLLLIPVCESATDDAHDAARCVCFTFPAHWYVGGGMEEVSERSTGSPAINDGQPTQLIPKAAVL